MAQAETFTISGPLPSRNAYDALRRQIQDFLVRTNAVPGEPFLSDHQLVQTSGLARNTVRRSLDLLTKDGWIERRHGKGTFVGPRVSLSSNPTTRAASDERAEHGEVVVRAGDTVRLAVLLGYPAGPRLGWYSMGVLKGLEEEAIAQRIAIELYNFGTSADHVRRRLAQSRPDVLACLSPHAQWAMLIAETQARGIPVLLTGTRLANMGIPAMYEDGAAGAELAVNYLLDKRHRRIAFVQDTVPVPWAFDRFQGYVRAMTKAGLDPDNGLTVWVDQETGAPDDGRIAKMLDRSKPTAILLGSAGVMRFMGPLLADRKLRVPEDLSLIVFDQAARESQWLRGQQVTIVALPLEEMGRLLARQARDAAAGKSVESSHQLACTLLEGDTVARL